MLRIVRPFLWLLFFLVGISVQANTPLAISLTAHPGNPSSPQMGDSLIFDTAIRNTSEQPTHGVVAWISLVQMDPGHEQPMDLEDWSAHKAVNQTLLGAGEHLTVEWPMRLIQSGSYRVVVSAMDREAGAVMTSPVLDFVVRPKPVVESKRILPVALGVPMVLSGLLFIAWYRRRRVRS